MIEKPDSNFREKVEQQEEIKTTTLLIREHVFEVPLLKRVKPDLSLPKNFMVEIPGKLWRGSWPEEQITKIESLGINKIVTLYSSNDAKEKEWLPRLQTAVAKTGIEQVVVDIDKNLDLVNAAVDHYDNSQRTYVHCQAGANRSGLFCLVAEIMEQSTTEQKLSNKDFVLILAKLLKGGYDYDQKKYIKYLNEVVNECIDRNLLSANLFC